MVKKFFLFLILPALMAVASSGWAQYQSTRWPAGHSVPGNSSSVEPKTDYHPAYPADQQSGSSTYSQQTVDGMPQYPYPPYHNPYYTGTPPRDFLSYTVDWLIHLPVNIVERLSNFVDTKFFPASAATSGAAQQSQSKGRQSSEDNKASVQTFSPPGINRQ